MSWDPALAESHAIIDTISLKVWKNPLGVSNRNDIAIGGGAEAVH